MTSEVIAINGLNYKVEYQGTLTSEQRQAMINKLTGRDIVNLATCPTVAKNVGEITTLTATGTEGTPPYTITFKRNGAVLPNGTFTGVGAGISKNYNYTIVSADAPSTTLSTEITDSCSSGTKTCGDQCVINVATPPPTCPTISCTFSVNGGAPPTTKYRCDTATNTCIADPNGPYSDLASCQAACTPPTVYRYACKTLYGVKYCDIDPTGPYTDYAQCIAACK